jgi:multiple sugar transport system permease protein
MIRAASILRNRDSLAAWTMVAPALLVTMVFALYPVLDSLWLSLHNIFIGLPQLGSPFVGFDNYLALVRDPVAQQALAVTLAFVILSTLLELACGLIIALVIHERFRGRGLVRAAILIPWAIPTVVASQLWRYIFNDQYGFANLLLFGEQRHRLRPLAGLSGRGVRHRGTGGCLEDILLRRVADPGRPPGHSRRSL